jgi:hypothetical protein
MIRGCAFFRCAASVDTELNHNNGRVEAVAIDALNVNNGAVGSRTPQRYIPVDRVLYRRGSILQ